MRAAKRWKDVVVKVPAPIVVGSPSEPVVSLL
jgi:hypothetical protein